jgi:hypothetical protein
MTEYPERERVRNGTVKTEAVLVTQATSGDATHDVCLTMFELSVLLFDWQEPPEG